MVAAKGRELPSRLTGAENLPRVGCLQAAKQEPDLSQEGPPTTGRVLCEKESQRAHHHSA